MRNLASQVVATPLLLLMVSVVHVIVAAGAAKAPISFRSDLVAAEPASDQVMALRPHITGLADNVGLTATLRQFEVGEAVEHDAVRTRMLANTMQPFDVGIRLGNDLLLVLSALNLQKQVGLGGGRHRFHNVVYCRQAGSSPVNRCQSASGLNTTRPRGPFTSTVSPGLHLRAKFGPGVSPCMTKSMAIVALSRSMLRIV